MKKIKPSQRTAEENRSLFDDDNDSDVEFLEEFMRTEKKKSSKVLKSGNSQTLAPSSSTKKEPKRRRFCYFRLDLPLKSRNLNH